MKHMHVSFRTSNKSLCVICLYLIGHHHFHLSCFDRRIHFFMISLISLQRKSFWGLATICLLLKRCVDHSILKNVGIFVHRMF